MAMQLRTLETPTKEDASSNGWEVLLPRLDPAVVHAPRVQNVWQKLDREGSSG